MTGQPEDLKHELGNAIGIALANLEGMIDGIVDTTPARLETVAASLRRAGALIARLPSAERAARSSGSRPPE
jgi:hypothetical protein